MRVEALDFNMGQNAILGVNGLQMGMPDLQTMMELDLNWYDGDLLKGIGANGLKSARNTSPVDWKGRVTRSARSQRGGSIDLHEVAKMLNVGANKMLILRLLKRSDLMALLYLMPKSQLVNALRLFSKSKLMRLLTMLPKKYLIKMLLNIFSIEELIKKMPTRELFNIMRSQKLTNRKMMQGFQQMDPQFIMQIFGKLFGNQDFGNMKFREMMQVFMQTDKSKLMEAMKSLPFKALQPLVTTFAKEDPQLLENLSGEFIFKLFDKMSKPTLLQGCMALPPEIIIKFLGQLPDPLLVLAVSQIDDHTLENYLISSQPQLLAMLAGGAAA